MLFITLAIAESCALLLLPLHGMSACNLSLMVRVFAEILKEIEKNLCPGRWLMLPFPAAPCHTRSFPSHLVTYIYEKLPSRRAFPSFNLATSTACRTSSFVVDAFPAFTVASTSSQLRFWIRPYRILTSCRRFWCLMTGLLLYGSTDYLCTIRPQPRKNGFYVCSREAFAGVSQKERVGTGRIPEYDFRNGPGRAGIFSRSIF